MPSPLVRALVDRHGYPRLDADTLDAFLAATAFPLLLVAGDPARYPDSDDVAVVLPELMAVFGEVLTPAVVAPAAERAVQIRYRFNRVPALVFLRHDLYLGVLTGIRDWNDYLADIADILGREPGPPPAYELPDGCRTAGARA